MRSHSLRRFVTCTCAKNIMHKIELRLTKWYRCFLVWNCTRIILWGPKLDAPRPPYFLCTNAHTTAKLLIHFTSTRLDHSNFASYAVEYQEGYITHTSLLSLTLGAHACMRVTVSVCVSVFSILPSHTFRWLQHKKCNKTKTPFSLKLLTLKIRSVINLLWLSQLFSSRAMFPYTSP